MSPAVNYPAGTVINDRYEFRRKLGSDGQVYEAHDRILDKPVALKVLHPVNEVPQHWDEAQRLEQLRSRFIVPVLNADVVTSSDLRYIVTELLEAGDLEAEAAESGLGLRDAVRTTQQIAAGIDRIHAAGMVHRDIKPANVLRRADCAVVSDLEFCCLSDAFGRTAPNGSVCTVAPEALSSQGYCSIASDIYSLGATAFYLLSGQYPVDHRIPRSEQKSLIVAGRVRSLRDMAPHVPLATVRVVNRALSVDPKQRHPKATDFGNDIVHSLRNGRDWLRTRHQGHVFCLEGSRNNRQGRVQVCCVTDGTALVVSARHAGNGRRIASVTDVRTTAAKLSAEVRKIIAKIP